MRVLQCVGLFAALAMTTLGCASSSDGADDDMTASMSGECDGGRCAGTPDGVVGDTDGGAREANDLPDAGDGQACPPGVLCEMNGPPDAGDLCGADGGACEPGEAPECTCHGHPCDPWIVCVTDTLCSCDGVIYPCDSGVCDIFPACFRDADCDDGLACTRERCDVATQRCAHTPDDSACEPSGSECQVAACSTTFGCVHVDVADDTACSGGRCREGVCVDPSTPASQTITTCVSCPDAPGLGTIVLPVEVRVSPRAPLTRGEPADVRADVSVALAPITPLIVTVLSGTTTLSVAGAAPDSVSVSTPPAGETREVPVGGGGPTLIAPGSKTQSLTVDAAATSVALAVHDVSLEIELGEPFASWPTLHLECMPVDPANAGGAPVTSCAGVPAGPPPAASFPLD